MRRSVLTVSILLVTSLLLGAGATLAGSVSGTVTYEGRVPNLRPLKMDADPGCSKRHSSAVKPEVLVLGEGNTMGNILVRVTGGAPKQDYPAPSEAVVLDQDGCIYKPHVSGVMIGQTFKILNSDGLLHNVHSLSKLNTAFNRAMPATVKEADYTFTKEEVFKIKCDVHPWMNAYVAVMAHPFFDVTGTDGKYSIDDLPDGTYEIEFWHEKLGTKTESVTLAGGASKTIDISLSAPQKK